MEIKELDKEWVALIDEALKIGLTEEEIRSFLQTAALKK
ncbi:anti-repressor SinI family protein [Falsibacillus albus]|uniref:DNA-binding anti-repressor SinI n=1 Tax=Falsibacillus albus TaxID=2478915 RepID=A0A3L7JVJ2_9BACI|nr:anti-repressor SinI family protein [Falsibacillus albus]RLQ94766.1 DNA-binding anti-repressor SinI [Falsibacillus albus]